MRKINLLGDRVSGLASILTGIRGKAAPWLASLWVLCLSLAAASAQTGGVHFISSIQLLTNQTVGLELGGGPPLKFLAYFDLYPLQASPDLVNWSPLATLLRTNNRNALLTYQDPSAAVLPQRYYRLPTNFLITPFFLPSGPFAVGSSIRMLTDPSRTNRYNIPTNSSFMATFWYPAQSQAGQWPAPYVEAKLAGYFPLWSSLTNVVPSFVAQVFSEAPVSTNVSAYPVVIYSHGLSDGYAVGGDTAGIRAENTRSAAELASYGYVVVAVDHIDCFASVFPDQTMVVRGISVDDVLNDADYYLLSRFQDVQFVLGQLNQMNQSDPLLANRLDLSHIGMMGWSFGGGTTAEFSRTNQQIQAVVLFDGYLDPVPDVISRGLPKPFLAMDSPNSGLAPENLTMFDNSTNTAYFLEITGTQHGTFTDEAWTTEPNAVTLLAGRAKDACMVSFFNKIFKNQDDHLLDAPTNSYSNIADFKKKP